MSVTRREFIVLAAAAAASASGCGESPPADAGPQLTGPATGDGSVASEPRVAEEPAVPANVAEEQVADAGPLSDFPEERVYDQFREQGYFVIRRAGEVFALSSVCTHKGCKVRAQPDQSYLCKCHRSRFDPSGKVLNGPAPLDLPRLPVAVDERQRLLVNLSLATAAQPAASDPDPASHQRSEADDGRGTAAAAAPERNNA